MPTLVLYLIITTLLGFIYVQSYLIHKAIKYNTEALEIATKTAAAAKLEEAGSGRRVHSRGRQRSSRYAQWLR